MSDQPNVTVEWEPPQQVSVHWPPPDTSYESMVPPEKPHGKWACICRLGGVGDNLVAASVLRPLKRLGYMNEFISEDPQYVVLENNPFLDKLSVKHGAADIPQHDMHLWQKWFDMRSREYDFLPNGSRAFVNLSHSIESLCAPFMAMTQFWWGADIRHELFNRNYLEAAHDIVFGPGNVPYEFGPLYFSSEEEKAKALATKKEVSDKFGDGRVIAWCVSGTRIDKIWPHAPMTIARVIKELGVPVVLIGAPGKDYEMATQILEVVVMHNSSKDGISIAISTDPNKPSFPVRRSLSFCQQADLLVAPDTGPSWACAFEDMPKVILTSHASPNNITKHWPRTITLHGDPQKVGCPVQGKHIGCHRLHDTIDTCCPNATNTGAACISEISVECAVAAIKSALGDKPALEQMRTKWASNSIVTDDF